MSSSAAVPASTASASCGTTVPRSAECRDDEGGPPAAAGAAAAAAATAEAAVYQQPGREEQQNDECQRPTVSFARMRAGLRSALKTECSGFKFQNGGRSLRWFRENAVDSEARSQLFWQGHVRLFEQQWEVVKPVQQDCLWLALGELDRAYRARYSVHNPASPSVDRSHAQIMLADGTVEHAMRWALDPRSGLENMMFSPRAADFDWHILLSLALQGRWTWLLHRWQAVVESSCGGKNWWRVMVAGGAIETGSLFLVQAHWSHVQARDRTSSGILRAIGRLGSIELLTWLVAHGLVRDGRENAFQYHVMKSAAEYGHVALMDALSRVPSVESGFDAMVSVFLCPACYGGHLAAVGWLVAKGAVPDSRCLNGAIKYGHYSLVHYFHTWRTITTDPVSERIVGELLYDSRPDCLAILEYLVQHFQYQPTSLTIARAAMAANVRSDVLCFLARHATPEAWDGALSHVCVRDDLRVQDLLRAAAYDSLGGRRGMSVNDAR